MKSIRTIVAALAAVLAIAGLAQATPAFADNSNKNEIAYWEAQLGDGTTCVKHDGDGAEGSITGGGTSVTLVQGTWVLLVVNSGSEGPDGDGNLVYRAPNIVAGEAYVGPRNHGGQLGNISHWIVCGTAATTTTTTTTVPAETTTTTTTVPEHVGDTTTTTEPVDETTTTTTEPELVESEGLPTTTETPTTTEAPTTTTDPQQESEAPTTTVAPTTQLPKTGNDHVTLVSVLAALLLGGGVAMSAVAARRRN